MGKLGNLRAVHRKLGIPEPSVHCLARRTIHWVFSHHAQTGVQRTTHRGIKWNLERGPHVHGSQSGFELLGFNGVLDLSEELLDPRKLRLGHSLHGRAPRSGIVPLLLGIGLDQASLLHFPRVLAREEGNHEVVRQCESLLHALFPSP